MTENNKNLGTDGFDPSKVKKLSAKEILNGENFSSLCPIDAS